MLKKLHIFVIKSYLGPFVMTFFIALFILLMQFVWKYIDDLVGKGLQWYVITQLLFYASLTFVPLALPLAVLLSSLMTFGNLGEKYELVAMKSAGISLRQIMSPLVIGAMMISLGAFYFSNDILPVANLKMRSLLYDVREQKPAVNIKEGVFYNGINNYVIRIGKREEGGGKGEPELRDIMIYDHTERMGNNNVTLAERGSMEFERVEGIYAQPRFLIFHLFNGINYTEDLSSRKKEERRPLQRTRFKEQYVRIDLSEFALTRTSEDLFKGNYTMLNLHQLNIVYDSLSKQLAISNNKFSERFRKDDLFYYSRQQATGNRQQVTENREQRSEVRGQRSDFSNLKPDIIENVDVKERVSIIETAIELARGAKESIFFENMDRIYKVRLINKHLVEYHRKFTLSLACLVFFLIGAPLGAIIRRGGFGLPVVVSTLFFLVYHIISIIGEKFTREGVFPPYIGMWLSTFVMMPIGIIIAYKAVTDSPILDADSWTKFFKRLHLIKKFKI